MVGILILSLLMVAVAVFTLGPRERVIDRIRFHPSDLGDDPEQALAASEARFDDIRDGMAKQIIWHDPVTRTMTDYAIVYIHGFSAAKPEVRPLPDMIAASLKANIFYTRLAGHGRTGAAMAEVTAQDWLDDVAEALAVGRRIGRRVIVMGTSTGGTAAAYAARNPELNRDIAAMIFLSPNFGIRATGSDLVTIPWGRVLVPMILGKQRSFPTDNEAYNRAWTVSYPMVSLLPMMALVQYVRRMRFDLATMPALFVHAPDDQVVKPSETRKIVAKWGGKTTWVDVTGTRGPNHHVVAGDIVNPDKTDEVFAGIDAWLQKVL